jgi:hypothetical protein
VVIDPGGLKYMFDEKPLFLRRIFRWEMWGILFIVLLGSFLHFTFELSGSWKPLGIISAVNESVWEHLKLPFWPALLFTLIEYCAFRRLKYVRSTFWLAKALGAYFMPVVIVVIFYSYTSFVEESLLPVDIATFVVAVIAGQFFSYYLLRFLNVPPSFKWIGLFMFLIGIILFAVFTFASPHLGIFQDPVGGGFGIQV